ncbi:MAG: tRNA 4-thiouridine(8) synthase ThiI [Lachnospiraceae bacterium]|nr:tRNA 4-thiouridine(8) synthase ThiI [Lachnospiraceae bacterium]
MKFQAFLIKYGEIGLKGKNRYVFEDALVRQIKNALKTAGEGKFEVSRINGRIFVHAPEDYDFDLTLSALKHVFGVTGICPVRVIPNRTPKGIAEAVVDFIRENYERFDFTFKINTRRANKAYPLGSMELDALVGEAVLEAFPDMRVDVHSPEEMIHIEVRKEDIYLYSLVFKGPGGMPVGTGGKAMLLLSGGIDSPVAGYMISKRGVQLDAVYFHAPPYTSERAKQKVVDLARIISAYAGVIYLHVINFTDIQMYIYDQCPHEELTIIMRRYMMRIAERLAVSSDCLGLVTGESIGQVASQTMKSLLATNEVCTLPVYRPLIGFDKQEIIEIAGNIGTFETSILPYEDCCTIFVAKHPVTKPNLNIIRRSELLLKEKIDTMVEEAVAGDEVIVIRHGEAASVERLRG